MPSIYYRKRNDNRKSCYEIKWKENGIIKKTDFIDYDRAMEKFKEVSFKTIAPTNLQNPVDNIDFSIKEITLAAKLLMDQYGNFSKIDLYKIIYPDKPHSLSPASKHIHLFYKFLERNIPKIERISGNRGGKSKYILKGYKPIIKEVAEPINQESRRPGLLTRLWRFLF